MSEPLHTARTANIAPAAALSEDRQRELLARMKTEFSAVHIAMRYWHESLYLFWTSVALTVVAICLMGAYSSNTEVQKARIFINAVACALAWCSNRRSRKGFEAGVESYNDVFYITVVRLWSFLYSVWFGVTIILHFIPIGKV